MDKLMKELKMIFEDAEKKLDDILEKKLKDIFQKITEAAPKNRCWWNMRACPYSFITEGFEFQGTFCYECSRVDWEKFVQLVKDLPVIRDGTYGIL